ncbi:MAG: hypothetical protein CVV42_05490 [Candidatus Riflebacteria bacterium HGW-Riflebacteria-2]|jgi:hypothetical protein|nr:MAG: hypothetical protein CVV42_05490 [Candidatus Riflebacteria bacterium HGW-Riflebacteria-2]
MQKKISRLLVLLLVTAGLLITAGRVMADTQFDFYYQRIEKVVQINDPEPEGWWEKTKAFVKSGVNAVKRTWEGTVTRNLNLGEGSKRWYSGEDHNIAYDVNRVKVKSEAHLLELMGVKDESQLTDGQKALLAVYRHSTSDNVKDRMQYSYRNKISVILSDTTGFDDPGKYPHVTDDFWPYSSGMTIQMSSGRYNWPGSEASARSTFVHEFAHSFDRTIKEFIKPYGKDGSHFANELTKPRTAFVEGWAEFNEMLDSSDKVRQITNSVSFIKLEDKNKAGTYTNVEPESLTGAQLLSVEGINAIILHRIATEVPGGKDKVFKAFTSTRWKLFRDLSTITKQLCRQNPDDIAAIAQIIDERTLGKLSDKEFKSYIGSSAAAREFLENRKKAAEATVEADSGDVKASGKPFDIKVYTDGANPFSVK